MRLPYIFKVPTIICGVFEAGSNIAAAEEFNFYFLGDFASAGKILISVGMRGTGRFAIIL